MWQPHLDQDPTNGRALVVVDEAADERLHDVYLPSLLDWISPITLGVTEVVGVCLFRSIGARTPRMRWSEACPVHLHGRIAGNADPAAAADLYSEAYQRLNSYDTLVRIGCTPVDLDLAYALRSGRNPFCDSYDPTQARRVVLISDPMPHKRTWDKLAVEWVPLDRVLRWVRFGLAYVEEPAC